MRLCRFTARAFFDGRIVEAGEEMLIPDDALLGAHMIDVAVGTAPVFAPAAQVAFRSALAAVHPTDGHVAERATDTISIPGGPLAPHELRAKLTEEARVRAEPTRQREEAERTAKADEEQTALNRASSLWRTMARAESGGQTG